MSYYEIGWICSNIPSYLMKFNTSPLQNLSTKLHFPILYLLSEKLNKSSGGFIPVSFNKIHWKSTMLKFILILVVVNIAKELDLLFTFCSKNRPIRRTK